MYNYNQQNFGQQAKALTKSQIRDCTLAIAANKYGVTIMEQKMIEDAPVSLRHSCIQTGICILNRDIADIPTAYGTISKPYYLCKACGKIYLVKEA